MITYVLIIAASLMLYTNYASVAMYTIAFALLWGCLGGWLAIAPTATASFFGMKDYAKNYGMVFTAYGIGAAIGGIVSAQARISWVAINPSSLSLPLLQCWALSSPSC